MELKLLTLNIHGWLEQNQLEKFKEIAQFIATKDIDIVAFQEVNQHKSMDLIDYKIRVDNPAHLISKLLRGMGKEYDYIWEWSHYGYDVYEEGVSILSKHKIVSQESRYVSKATDKLNWKSRNIIKGVIEVEDRLINVYSVHMGWHHDVDEPFAGQLEKLDNFIDEEDKLSIVMGDFNNPDVGEGYQLIKSYGYKDLYRDCKKDAGNTIHGSIAGWEENDEGFRIDYIFAKGEAFGVEAEVIFEEKPVSDHSGVYVKVKI